MNYGLSLVRALQDTELFQVPVHMLSLQNLLMVTPTRDQDDLCESMAVESPKTGRRGHEEIMWLARVVLGNRTPTRTRIRMLHNPVLSFANHRIRAYMLKHGKNEVKRQDSTMDEGLNVSRWSSVYQWAREQPCTDSEAPPEAQGKSGSLNGVMIRNACGSH